MSEGAPDKKDGDSFDVVLMHSPTDDGKGARVLRARPGRIDAGEVRPMREGRPIAAGGEVVRLERRTDMPALYDVHVEYAMKGAESSEPGKKNFPRTEGRPAQVATRAYRDNWELTFGSRQKVLN